MKVYIAGHLGMVGSAIIRKLEASDNAKSIEIITSNRNEVDLTDQTHVKNFFAENKPDRVVICAAKVGGILANNNFPAEFIYQNLMIQSNLIHQSFLSNVDRLLFLGSSCIYPRLSNQPIREDYLLTGTLEPTNEPYAIAKIAGIKLCESYNRQYGVDYRSIMPTNLYGVGDNFHPKNSHVIPGLIRRFHEAKINNDKQISIWGSGKPYREFLHVDDMAQASLFILDLDKEELKKHTKEMCSHINVGSGAEISIKDLANLIKKVIGYNGEIIFDTSIPDGMHRKLMDTTLINNLGWSPSIKLQDGLVETYKHFKELV